MIRNIVLILLLMPFLTSCWEFGRRAEIPGKAVGYKPTYSNDPSLLNITVEAPKAVKNAGKIYVLGNIIFQNEVGQGIHVLDKTDPNQLKNIGFINIRGNTEISIKETFLYANSYNDLVVVDLSDWKNPVEIKRVKNAFQVGAQTFQPYIPVPEKNAYAKCVDPSLGVHTGWTKDTILFSDCYFLSH